MYLVEEKQTHLQETNGQLTLPVIVRKVAFKQAYKRGITEIQKQTGINSETNGHIESPKDTMLLA